MGLFDIILKGLGFSDEEEMQPTEQPQPKPKKHKQISNATFDLSKDELLPEETIVLPSKQPEKAPEQSTINFQETSNKTNIVSPRNHSDIQSIVETMRKRQAIIVNFSALSNRDAERGLDFLSGAIFVMRGSMEKIQDNMFLFSPPTK